MLGSQCAKAFTQENVGTALITIISLPIIAGALSMIVISLKVLSPTMAVGLYLLRCVIFPIAVVAICHVFREITQGTRKIKQESTESDLDAVPNAA